MNTEAETILDILGERPEFSKLLELPTLFAPTNEAFDSISDTDYPTHDELMYHISDHAYSSSRLHKKDVIESLYESPGLNNAAQLLRISLEHPKVPSTSFKASFWRMEPEVWIEELDGDGDGAETLPLSLFVNHAKVILPDIVAKSGAIVHGVNSIIRLPGETVVDEIVRRGVHFSFLTRSWTKTGVDDHIRDAKGVTLFAASDKAWKALPKKLCKWLFSDKGREHLKIVAMYQVANRALYTPEIFNKTREDGTPGKEYHDIVLQSLLHSPQFKLHVHAKETKSGPTEDAGHSKIEYKPKGLTDLVEDFRGRFKGSDLVGWGESAPSVPDNQDDHHYPHRNPNHPHHHPHCGDKHQTHRHHRHHRDAPHNGGNGSPKLPRPSPVPRRDEIFVNEKARVMHGYENWIAGNGVVHVVDKVLMPPRGKGCKNMSAMECAAWETMWDLANVGIDAVVDDAVIRWDDQSISESKEVAEDSEDEQEFHTFEDMDEEDEPEEGEALAFALY
ncbi:hypothetical protein BG011_001503 [Mortierella polycephala]|uniref:FAS1 domain-containing protein n=1 Tax=Mortierella polycephala TaxID=41804 RepID=A0A9P6QHD6_9FUNG|nr:hypothetical protein BG011_001503 [Mortierella polycephala]